MAQKIRIPPLAVSEMIDFFQLLKNTFWPPELLAKEFQVNVEYFQPSVGLSLLRRSPLSDLQPAHPPRPLWHRKLPHQAPQFSFLVKIIFSTRFRFSEHYLYIFSNLLNIWHCHVTYLSIWWGKNHLIYLVEHKCQAAISR